MLALLAALLVAPSALQSQQPPRDQDCIACHRALTSERLSRPVAEYETDVHRAKGLGCLACHGVDPSDPTARPDPTSGFLGKPERRAVVRLCGRCHSNAEFMRRYNPSLRVDQVAEYVTSIHGKRLMEFNDPKVATCVSCHPAHAIKPPSDPLSTVHPLNVVKLCGSCHADSTFMAEYRIPTDQHTQYERSVHWRQISEEGDLSAPTCNDCHGNHGAAPPGVASVQYVCGQCHSVMQAFFDGGVHAELFRSEGLPGCATCHGDHHVTPADDSTLVRVTEVVCGKCHAEGDERRVAFLTMKDLIDSLRADLDRSEAILGQAENVGMEVSQAQFELGDATTSIIKARTAVHAFVPDSVRAQLAAGFAITARAAARGEAALGEHLFRRQGLAVSVLLILLLVAGLALTIKQLERRSHPPADQDPR